MPVAPRASGPQPAFCVPGVGGLAAAAQNPFCAGVGGRRRQGSRVGVGGDGHPTCLLVCAGSSLPGSNAAFLPVALFAELSDVIEARGPWLDARRYLLKRNEPQEGCC